MISPHCAQTSGLQLSRLSSGRGLRFLTPVSPTRGCPGEMLAPGLNPLGACFGKDAASDFTVLLDCGLPCGNPVPCGRGGRKAGPHKPRYGRLLSAPAPASNSTTSVWPLRSASTSGDSANNCAPNQSQKAPSSTVAPARKSSAETTVSPAPAATASGVRCPHTPYSHGAPPSGRAPACSNASTVTASPADAAANSGERPPTTAFGSAPAWRSRRTHAVADVSTYGGSGLPSGAAATRARCAAAAASTAQSRGG